MTVLLSVLNCKAGCSNLKTKNPKQQKYEQVFNDSKWFKAEYKPVDSSAKLWESLT